MKKKNALSLLAVMIVTLGMIVVYGHNLGEQLISSEKEWINANQEIEKKRDLLQELRLQIGYGGFIHNFKTMSCVGTIAITSALGKIINIFIQSSANIKICRSIRRKSLH